MEKFPNCLCFYLFLFQFFTSEANNVNSSPKCFAPFTHDCLSRKSNVTCTNCTTPPPLVYCSILLGMNCTTPSTPPPTTTKITMTTTTIESPITTTLKPGATTKEPGKRTTPKLGTSREENKGIPIWILVVVPGIVLATVVCCLVAVIKLRIVERNELNKHDTEGQRESIEDEPHGELQNLGTDMEGRRCRQTKAETETSCFHNMLEFSHGKLRKDAE